MILSKDPGLVQVGASGIILLMAAALLTHLRVKNKLHLMVPSFALLSSCVLILIHAS